MEAEGVAGTAVVADDPPGGEQHRLAGVPVEEMRRTFNLGIGMIVVVAPEHLAEARRVAEEAGETVYELGQVEETPGREPAVRFL